MGKLVEIKTKANESSVSDFLNAILDEEKRKDSYDILQLMEKVTKEKAKLWGNHLSDLDSTDIKVQQQKEKLIGLKLAFLLAKLIFHYISFLMLKNMRTF